jgi:hypothetical protein
MSTRLVGSPPTELSLDTVPTVSLSDCVSDPLSAYSVRLAASAACTYEPTHSTQGRQYINQDKQGSAVTGKRRTRGAHLEFGLVPMNHKASS